MRAIGETMVVWMASGNAAQIPTPWYNLLQPVRTLTATIAGDMGEADQVTGSARYHVLFAMALCLLTIAFVVQPGQRACDPPRPRGDDRVAAYATRAREKSSTARSPAWGRSRSC